MGIVVRPAGAVREEKVTKIDVLASPRERVDAVEDDMVGGIGRESVTYPAADVGVRKVRCRAGVAPDYVFEVGRPELELFVERRRARHMAVQVDRYADVGDGVRAGSGDGEVQSVAKACSRKAADVKTFGGLLFWGF